jgi:small-conductance mechanosensitive channel
MDAMADTPTTAATTAQSSSKTAEFIDRLTGAEAKDFIGTLTSNPAHTWIVAVTTLLVAVLVVMIVKRVVLRYLERLAARTSVKWDDLVIEVLKKVRLWLLLPALVLAASQAVQLPDILDKILRFLAVCGLGIQFLMMASKVVDFGLQAMANRSQRMNGEPDATVASSLGVARVVCMGLIGVVVVLLALDNLGVKITPMLTGLGIGGIAVALAVQNILGDLFGSLTIILDKPFVIGDSIAVGDKSGTVERIGIKTTRVRSTTGEELIFANSDLLTSRVQNFKRMRERRVSFVVPLVYDTPAEKLALVPGIIRAAVEKEGALRFDRSHLRGFGANGIEFETVYFVRSADYMQYMDAQQAINMEILREFAGQEIQIAPLNQPFARVVNAAVAAQAAQIAAGAAAPR